MLKSKDRLVANMSVCDMETVRTAYIDRARIESCRIADTKQWMLDSGFEVLDIPSDQLLSDDGREVLHLYGNAWALKPEVHAQRLAEAMERAKQRDAAMAEQQPQPTQPIQPPTTCTSLIDGQLCGGTLIRASVCPRCALGKSGVEATLTCDVCGHVTAITKGGANG